MKKILSGIFSAILLCGAVVSCDMTIAPADAPSSKSIFPETAPDRNPLDKWLLENFTYPYNVEVTYKYDDVQTDPQYTVVPADSAKAAKLAKILKYMWFDPYDEIVGNTFLKTYAPRQIMIIGSGEYHSEGTVTLGYATGSIKIALLNVNNLTESALRDIETLNSWYLSTLHHEFCHILNQKIAFDRSFEAISQEDYVSGDWYRVGNTEAYKKGFVRNYAMQEANEDFAETFSDYVVYSEAKWNSIITTAGDNAVKIESKLDIIRNYMQTSFGINIDELRAIVQRRSSELKYLDLENL